MSMYVDSGVYSTAIPSEWTICVDSVVYPTGMRSVASGSMLDARCSLLFYTITRSMLDMVGQTDYSSPTAIASSTKDAGRLGELPSIRCGSRFVGESE